MEFCHNIDLDYVSSSPYRMLIARLAAAQAVVDHRRKAEEDQLRLRPKPLLNSALIL